ncbi:MAG: VOC family protein [Aphanocapsa sp. GSE-SYN-MK-11-07L]|jgi:PhnB protein|nr:VOC family protein [Aphanocapsa sp. GSE-SYN-MK-11-07L]
MHNSPISDPTLIPYLAVDDAKQAISFYQHVFDAKELYRLIDPETGKIGHAELLLNGTKIMLADEYPTYNKTPQTLGGTAVTFALMVNDVDASVVRASAAGAIVVRPPNDEFYGHRSATIRDPFGHEWMFQKEIEKVEPTEIQRRWDQMVKKS